jgi:hypothetical protein
MPFEKRNTTRVDLWLNVIAEVRFETRLITGKVKNLGSRGMFLLTRDTLPIATVVKVLLVFKLKNSNDLHLRVSGAVVWYNEEGMGIQFDEIDLEKFRKCVVAMVNDS